MAEMTVLLPPPLEIEQEEDNLYYPESDGKPMAETDLHRDMMFYLIHLLRRYLAGTKAYVSGNLLIYYEKGNTNRSVAPDCFVVLGVEQRRRNTYRIWQEGRTPDVVFEVTSKSTRRDDTVKKMRLYAKLGIKEYFLYDPTSDYLDPPLAAYELAGDGYLPMEPLNEDALTGLIDWPEEDGGLPEYESKVLGVRLVLDEEEGLCLYNVQTGERLLTDEEARIKAEQEKQWAEQERQQAEQRAAAADAENARLRAEVERLRGQNQG
ncbi:MAG: Uma2 family endonuclease [Caldilineaceae bacterium]